SEVFMSLSTRPSAQTASHPLLRVLAGGAAAAAALQELNGQPAARAEALDFDPQTSFLVLETDPAQRQCVEMAARGLSFALTGAAGTGKTQTLVNIIADCLARGKKVLCVSRQPASLKRIVERIKQAGLAEFC